jgi:hypothetical protein
VQPKHCIHWLTAAASLLIASPVWAHGGDASPLWGGALHVLASPLVLTALMGLIAALFGTPEQLCFRVAGVTAASAAASSLAYVYIPVHASWVNTVTPWGIACVGLAALAGWPRSTRAAVSLAVFTGCTAGLATQLDNTRWQSVVGLAGTVALIVVCGLVVFHETLRWPKFQRILPIARRVAGSWVMAVGLMLGALAVSNPSP